MADTTVFSDAINNEFNHGTRAVVSTSDDVVYFFYVDETSSGNNALNYAKSVDGGASFDCPVTVENSERVTGFSVWFDKWTNGDPGTNIHICWMEAGSAAVTYRRLNTASDTLSSEVGVADPGVANTPSWFHKTLDITKARGGNLYINVAAFDPALNQHGESFEVSTDGGVSWCSGAQLSETNTASNMDRVILLPGNEADDNDIWAIYYDDSAQELSLKVYDSSCDSFSETSIATGIDFPLAISLSLAGAPRHSDDHIIVVAMDVNTPFSDQTLLAWDINGSGSITALTDILTNEGFAIACDVVVDQTSDDLYVFYSDGGANINLVDVYYVKSEDGGCSWSCPVAYSESCASSYHEIWSTVSIAAHGGRIGAGFNDRANDAVLWNEPNSVTIAGDAAPAFRAGNLNAKLIEVCRLW